MKQHQRPKTTVWLLEIRHRVGNVWHPQQMQNLARNKAAAIAQLAEFRLTHINQHLFECRVRETRLWIHDETLK